MSSKGNPKQNQSSLFLECGNLISYTNEWCENGGSSLANGLRCKRCGLSQA